MEKQKKYLINFLFDVSKKIILLAIMWFFVFLTISFVYHIIAPVS